MAAVLAALLFAFFFGFDAAVADFFALALGFGAFRRRFLGVFIKAFVVVAAARVKGRKERDNVEITDPKFVAEISAGSFCEKSYE